MLKLTGNLEQQILNILWDSKVPLKPIEVQELMDNSLSYSTIKTTLERLEDKGALKRKKIGNVYFYSPILTKEKYSKKNLKTIFKSVINSYGELAISQFLESIKEDPENQKLLEEYLNDKK